MGGFAEKVEFFSGNGIFPAGSLLRPHARSTIRIEPMTILSRGGRTEPPFKATSLDGCFDVVVGLGIDICAQLDQPLGDLWHRSLHRQREQRVLFSSSSLIRRPFEISASAASSFLSQQASSNLSLSLLTAPGGCWQSGSWPPFLSPLDI